MWHFQLHCPNGKPRKKNFLVNGRESFCDCPEKPLEGNPWIWRAEFFGAFAQADKALLERGWHLAYHKVSDLYGCPSAIQWMHEFRETAVKELELSQKAVLFGFSRGGLYACNYALTYPAEVSALYLDAPVLDIRSWPGGKGTGCGAEREWQECLSCYGLTEKTRRPLPRILWIVRRSLLKPVFPSCWWQAALMRWFLILKTERFSQRGSGKPAASCRNLSSQTAAITPIAWKIPRRSFSLFLCMESDPSIY